MFTPLVSADFHLTLYGLSRALGAALGIWWLPAILGRTRGIDTRVWEWSFLPVIAATYAGSILAGHFLLHGLAGGLVKLAAGDIYLAGGEGVAGFIAASLTYLAIWRWLRLTPAMLADVKDTLAASVAFLVAIFKLGCHFAGCCQGILYDGPLAVSFPAGTPACLDQTAAGLLPPGAAQSLPVFPAQLVEAGVMAAFGLVLIQWYLRRRFRSLLGHICIIGFCVWRIFSEWLLRSDSGRGLLGPVTITQLICLVVMVSTAGLMWVDSRRDYGFEQ